MLNRRTFLRSLAAACGVAVVCPGVLLKGKTEREILLEKFRAAFKATKFKPPVSKGTRLIIGHYDEYLKLRAVMIRHYKGQYFETY